MKKYIRKLKNRLSLQIRATKQYMEGVNYHVSYEESLTELEKFSPNPRTSCYYAGGDTKVGGVRLNNYYSFVQQRRTAAHMFGICKEPKYEF